MIGEYKRKRLERVKENQKGLLAWSVLLGVIALNIIFFK